MESEEYKEFTKAIIALDGLLRCGEIISEDVCSWLILFSTPIFYFPFPISYSTILSSLQIQEKYFLPPKEPAIVLYRDYDERKSVYEGPWEAAKIEEWARLLEHPTVGFVNSQTIGQYFRKKGVMVHLFVDPESIENDWNAFQDYIFQEVSLPVVNGKIMKRTDFTIVFCDGKENARWLKSSNMDPKVLPAVLLIDFVRYSPQFCSN